MVVNYDLTVCRVIAAVRFYNHTSETSIFRKNRNQWAVALKISGTTYYNVDGDRILSDKNHPVLLPRGSSYSWKCVEPGECLMIEFEALQSDKNIYSLAPSDTNVFVRVFHQIHALLDRGEPDGRMTAIYKLYGLLLQLFKTEDKEYISPSKKDLLQPAVKYISDKYQDPTITNDRLAELCGISTVYFRKCFEQAYGMSPIRYLHEYRMQKAKAILSSDYSSISQVAESVGYSSLYHFSKMFKIYTGLNPTQYAKASRK